MKRAALRTPVLIAPDTGKALVLDRQGVLDELRALTAEQGRQAVEPGARALVLLGTSVNVSVGYLDKPGELVEVTTLEAIEPAGLATNRTLVEYEDGTRAPLYAYFGEGGDTFTMRKGF